MTLSRMASCNADVLQAQCGDIVRMLVRGHRAGLISRPDPRSEEFADRAMRATRLIQTSTRSILQHTSVAYSQWMIDHVLRSLSDLDQQYQAAHLSVAPAYTVMWSNLSFKYRQLIMMMSHDCGAEAHWGFNQALRAHLLVTPLDLLEARS